MFRISSVDVDVYNVFTQGALVATFIDHDGGRLSTLPI